LDGDTINATTLLRPRPLILSLRRKLVSGYRTLKVHGDHYAMGWQHGRQVQELLPQIVEAMAGRSRQVEQDGRDAPFEALVRETRELLERDDRSLLVMIRGQADGLGLAFDALLRHNLVGSLHDDLVIRNHRDREACTTWAAVGSATIDGRPILVKNRDSSLEHLGLQAVVHASPESGYPYLYITSAGSPGVYCGGINQAGLAVVDTHVYSTDMGPGLPDYSLMMHVLEDHATVLSALDFLRSAPRLGRNSLVLADALGHLAVFEIGHRAYGLFECSDGILVNTNHFVSRELQGCFVELGPLEQRCSTWLRHERTTRELDASLGQIDVALAQRLMATHDGPQASICCHPEDNSGSTTISTSIFLPAQRQMLFCHGLPCRGRFDEFYV
jgi:isopenicillin-N N-acyltransferase-like protein